MAATKFNYRLLIEASVNGRIGRSTVTVLDDEDTTVATDKGDLADDRELSKLAERLAGRLDYPVADLVEKLRYEWCRAMDRVRQQRQEEERLAREETAAVPKGQEDIDARADRLLKDMPSSVVEWAKQYLRQPGLVERIDRDIQAMGVAGERQLGRTLYLAGTSRLLPRPLAALVRGPSSSGKSYVIERVAALFPPEAVLVATAMTPQALYYMELGMLRHRWVIAGERSRSTEDEVADATKALREMISAGRLSKLIPVKSDGGMTTVLLEQEGPIAYAESTTRERIFDEDENRLLSVYTDEQPEQTRRIISRLAKDAAATGVAVDDRAVAELHHAAQRLLRRREVVIPFAEQLGEMISEERVEARRAFPHLLSMIRASALLHQYQRQQDDAGRVIATGEDYRIARALMLGPLTRLLGSGVSQAARRFLERLEKVWGDDSSFSTSEARRKERYSKSAVCEWLKELAEAGLVRVVEEGRGRKPASWQVVEDGAIENNDVLPAEEDVLPATDDAP
jgi:hypothetical protein